MEKRWLLRSDIEELRGPQGIPGGTLILKGEYDPDYAYSANDGCRYDGRTFYALQDTTGNAPPEFPDESNDYWELYAERGADGVDGQDGAKTIWVEMPTPTRLSDTSFKISDVGNANGYDLLYSVDTIISWEDGMVGWQCAKIQSATYSSDWVTFTIMGNTLSVTFGGTIKNCIFYPHKDSWDIPGMMPTAALADIGKAFRWPEDRYVFSAKIYYDTASTTTKGVWDVNDDTVSLFTTKPEIAAGSTAGNEQQSDSISGTSLVVVAGGSKVTLDYDSGHATTPGADATVILWSFPKAWRYSL